MLLGEINDVSARITNKFIILFYSLKYIINKCIGIQMSCSTFMLIRISYSVIKSFYNVNLDEMSCIRTRHNRVFVFFPKSEHRL